MSPLKLIISTMLPETLVVRPAASAAPPAAACVEARVLEEAVDNQGMGGWGACASEAEPAQCRQRCPLRASHLHRHGHASAVLQCKLCV